MSEEKKDCCSTGSCCSSKKVLIAAILGIAIFAAGFLFAKCPLAGCHDKGGMCPISGAK